MMPDENNLYEIDLDSRIIKAPEFLSIEDDHAAQTIYFLVDRFYDNMDLSTTACVVQYINSNKEEYYYSVPFYDITTFSTTVSDQFTQVVIDEHMYRTGEYYIWNSATQKYDQAIGAFDIEKNYFVKVSPKLNEKYIPIKLLENKYTPGKFYCIDTDTTSETYGKYLLDNLEFDSQKQYYILTDKRYIPITVPPSSYQKKHYYIVNSNGQLELSTENYSKDETYFTFTETQKMIFPWIISKSVTKEAGKIQFSVRFFQINTEIDDNGNQTHKYVYNLNTRPASSSIIEGMNDIVNAEAVDFDADKVAYFEQLIADIQYDYHIYWEEA